MRSAAALCQDSFPNGTVLDIMLHPSAVSGDDGSRILLSLVKSYFALCGWNVYFVDLSEKEQDELIRQAK